MSKKLSLADSRKILLSQNSKPRMKNDMKRNVLLVLLTAYPRYLTVKEIISVNRVICEGKFPPRFLVLKKPELQDFFLLRFDGLLNSERKVSIALKPYWEIQEIVYRRKRNVLPEKGKRRAKRPYEYRFRDQRSIKRLRYLERESIRQFKELLKFGKI